MLIQLTTITDQTKLIEVIQYCGSFLLVDIIHFNANWKCWSRQLLLIPHATPPAFFFKFSMDCCCWFVLRCFRTPASRTPWNPLSHVCQWVYFLSRASGACCQTMKTKHAAKTGARKDPLQISSYISSSCLSSPRVSSGLKNVDGLMRLVITRDAAALVGQLQNPSLGHFSSI